ncbi:MAG: 4Fe-4S dicluster domain-containing protein [Acidobacteriia bacterium]|nr:4Fe-4S dicluster domain-containing protein [Terriglobia bacterium]
MKISRKDFLRLSGLSLLAVVGKKAIGALAGKGAQSAAALPAVRVTTRWAMVIDPAKCLKEEGCTKCISACHKAHNVPTINDPRHEVKWIWKEPFENAFASQESAYTEAALQGKPVMVFCNHCDNPPCVRVCPTQATWKREDGIVMMDWHRCIGCRYCMAACPYGSRSFNWFDPRPYISELNPDYPTRTKGVVEKCTFCEERLAKGQAPLCVEACPEKALVFGNLADPKSEVRRLLDARFSIRRKPELGTHPEVFYLV